MVVLVWSDCITPILCTSLLLAPHRFNSINDIIQVRRLLTDYNMLCQTLWQTPFRMWKRTSYNQRSNHPNHKQITFFSLKSIFTFWNLRHLHWPRLPELNFPLHSALWTAPLSNLRRSPQEPSQGPPQVNKQGINFYQTLWGKGKDLSHIRLFNPESCRRIPVISVKKCKIDIYT